MVTWGTRAGVHRRLRQPAGAQPHSQATEWRTAHWRLGAYACAAGAHFDGSGLAVCRGAIPSVTSSTEAELRAHNLFIQGWVLYCSARLGQQDNLLETGDQAVLQSRRESLRALLHARSQGWCFLSLMLVVQMCVLYNVPILSSYIKTIGT